ncbi:MAG: Putative transmembrane protein, partial [uncultured Blastococcus sp.]
LQPRRDRCGRVLAAARLRHGRRGDPPRRPGEVRLVHRLRPAPHGRLAVPGDPASALVPAERV